MQKQINIDDNKYWKIFHEVATDWIKLVKQSSNAEVSVADIIANRYNISYIVAADIAGSIALRKAID